MARSESDPMPTDWGQVGSSSAELSAAEVFAQLAVELHDADGLEETVEAVVDFAVQAVACTDAGVMLTARGTHEVGAVTDSVVAEIIQWQVDRGEGPVVSVLADGSAVSVPDVAAETRWPGISEKVAGYGIGSALHVPLWLDGQLLGVLSLFNVKPNAFDVDDEAIAHILAQHASVAVAEARDGETMTAAVDARKLVGQAMGILMERYDLDSDRAFAVLRTYSQETNTKLRDVAKYLIDSRNLQR